MKRLSLVVLAACGGATPAPNAPPANTAPPEPPAGSDHVIDGTLLLPSSASSGVSIFIIAKPVAGGAPLAVAKIVYVGGGSIAFHLDDRDSMFIDAVLTGDVVVTARYDQDGDAITKQPGDLVGSASVHVPAHGVAIHVDTAL
ncbi:MAG TPA: hypothetical protein VGG28_20300 [Kofleriaceae bacterium]|jgi:hypothetical protein